MHFSFNSKQPARGDSAPRQIDLHGPYQPPPRPRTPWIFEDQIAANRRGTFLLMALFSLFLVAIVWAAGILFAPAYAYVLAGLAALIAFATSYYSFFHSDKIVLSMSGAVEATRDAYPHLINTLEGLTIAAGLPHVPKAYIIVDSAPNAFATGRDPEHAAVAVTTGLLEKLDRYQLEGVLAHELSHVAGRDILLSTVAAVMVGTIVLLSDWVLCSLWYSGGGRRRRSSRSGGGGGAAILLLLALLAMVVAPIVAQLLRLAVSRQREYLADAHAIKLTRYPEGLAGALEAIANDYAPLEAANKATAHLYIANPLQKHGVQANDLFSTHPPMAERIARLRRM